MTFKSFISTRNKLNKLNSRIFQDKQEINHKQANDSIIISDASNFSLTYQNLNKIQKFDSDWEEADIFQIEDTIYYIYKTWQVKFLNINIKYLPFVQSEILVKYGGKTEFNVPYGNYFAKNLIWDIKDIEENEDSDNKNATLHASIYIAKDGIAEIPYYQTKLLVYFIPYQSLN